MPDKDAQDKGVATPLDAEPTQDDIVVSMVNEQQAAAAESAARLVAEADSRTYLTASIDPKTGKETVK